MRIIGIIVILLGLMGMSCAPMPRSYHYVSSLGAASPIRTYRVYVDSKFGEMDKVSIGNSIDQWNIALNGAVRIEVINYDFDMTDAELLDVSNGAWVIMKINSHNSLVGSREVGAWANRVGGNKIWVVRDRVSNSMIGGVVMHEIGHLLGAEHSRVGLMMPGYDKDWMQCVDYHTIKAVGKYHGIGINRLSYCVYH